MDKEKLNRVVDFFRKVPVDGDYARYFDEYFETLLKCAEAHLEDEPVCSKCFKPYEAECKLCPICHSKDEVNVDVILENRDYTLHEIKQVLSGYRLIKREKKI